MSVHAQALAIQVGIFISYLRGGFWGAWAGGAFLLPNFVVVSVLGQAGSLYGTVIEQE